MDALNVSSRNVTPTPFVPPTCLSVAGCPRLALHHLGEQGQTDTDDFAVFSQTSDRLRDKGLLFLAYFAEMIRQGSKSPAKSRQHFFSMADWKEIDGRGIRCFDKSDFDLSHEASRRHPEIISHHDDALESASIALPERLNKVRMLYLRPGMEPLLELIKDNQHLLAYRNSLATSQCLQRFFEAQIVFECWTTLPQSIQKTGFRFFRCGFDINRDHIFGEPGRQSRLDQ